MNRRERIVLAFGLFAWASTGHLTASPVSSAPRAGDEVQFTIRICEGQGAPKFWFNDEAREHSSECKLPLPEIPVYIVTDTGKREEGTTSADGIVTLPALSLSPAEKFRLGMACTTHNCFSLRGLFIGAPDIKPGANLFYAEVGIRVDQTPKK